MGSEALRTVEWSTSVVRFFRSLPIWLVRMLLPMMTSPELSSSPMSGSPSSSTFE